MKMKQKNKKWRDMALVMSVLAVSFAGCTDDAKVKAVYDPSVAPVIDRFMPDSGRVATQLLIYGSNFGSDISLIKVFVNDKPAALIGASDDGGILYALVPSRTRDEDGMCEVRVEVGTDAVRTAVAPKTFYYALSQNVSTLAGFTDRDGNTAIVDGTLDEAQFNEPYWLAFDENQDLYLIEENNGLRFIDFDRNPVTQVIESGVVSTKFRTGGGVDRPRTIAFTLDWDTMLIVNDGGDWTSIGTIVLKKDHANPDNSFKSWQAVANHKQCNGGAIHPFSNSYFFNSYEQSQVYKMTRGTPPWTYQPELFKVQDRNWEFNIQFAPSGNFAYIVSVNQHYIAKSEYDWENDVLKTPTVFAGTKQRSGHLDGVGTSALFNTPHQGAFDERDNFYLCDALNHCIRRITPDGQVSTFAGRPGNYGYSDGALRDAQFDRPFGIAYDAKIKTFFIADQKNRRIRTITEE